MATFKLGGLEHGDYVLLVMNGSNIIHHQAIRAYSAGLDKSNLKIEVPSAP